MNVLVLNCDSSRVRFQILETDQDLIKRDTDRRLARGVIERIGGQALVSFQAEGHAKDRRAESIRDHRAAIDSILRWTISRESHITGITSLGDIHAVGHRIVHGGEHFRRPVKITDDVIEKIEDCIELAPFHNPANLKGIRAATELLGDGVPQVAVFNTGFHSTMPQASYLYAIPYQLYRRHKIRRYGFHGTAHRYLAYRYRKMHGIEREKVNIITLYLGEGCSACGIKEGNSFVTSMGFTPLEGLVMGSRSGTIDPSLIEYLTAKEGNMDMISDLFIAGKDHFGSYRIPSIISTSKGALLAFAEARKKLSDHAENKIVLKRSFDGGETWSGLQVIANAGRNSLNNPLAVKDSGKGRILLMYQQYPLTRQDEVKAPGLWKSHADQLFPPNIHEAAAQEGYEGDRICRTLMISSEDDGETWTPPTDLTRSVKRPKKEFWILQII